MLEVETKYPVRYSNAKGTSKDGVVSAENRLFSESSKAERKTARGTMRSKNKMARSQRSSGKIDRKEFRQLKRSNRKAKRNATKLQLVDRFLIAGKPVFAKRLIKLVTDGSGKRKKTYPDGKTVEVAQSDVIRTPQGEYDKNDFPTLKTKPATAITQEDVKNATIITATTPATSGTTSIASNTDPSASVSIPFAPEQVVETDGSFYSSDDTQPVEEAPKDVSEEDDQNKRPLKKWEKGLIIGGAIAVSLVIAYVIYQKTRKNA
jgi:hypothetical protein